MSSPLLAKLATWSQLRQSLCRICVAEGRSLFISWDGLNKNCPLVLVFLAGYSGFPGGSDSRESSCNVGDLGLIPGVGRSPGGGHGNLLQCSGLENPHLRRHLQATVHGVAKSLTWLSDLAAAAGYSALFWCPSFSGYGFSVFILRDTLHFSNQFTVLQNNPNSLLLF